MCAITIWIATPFSCHTKKKKEKKKSCQRSKHCQYEREEIHPETLLNHSSWCRLLCFWVFLCIFFFCIFVDIQPNVNETSGYFQHKYSTVWQQNIIQLSEKYQQQTSSFDLSPSEMKGVGFFFSGVVILHRCWNHTREEGLFLLQTIPITSSTLETTTWRRGYVRQAEGKWTNQRGKKKNDCRLATPTNNFFRFCLLSSGEAE